MPALYLLVRNDQMMDNHKVEKHVDKTATDSYVKYYTGGPAGKHFLMLTTDRDSALADLQLFLESRGGQIDGIHHATSVTP